MNNDLLDRLDLIIKSYNSDRFTIPRLSCKLPIGDYDCIIYTVNTQEFVKFQIVNGVEYKEGIVLGRPELQKVVDFADVFKNAYNTILPI